MNKMPKLRFKEFSGEWEEKKLKDSVEYISSGKTKGKEDVGRYKVYGSTGIIGYTNNTDYIGEHVLIARVGANAGMVNIINEECGVSDNTLIIKYKNSVYPKFSYYQLKKYDLNKLIFGSGQPLITGGQLKNLLLGYPNIEEQQKIANFFSLIDKKIEKQQEKVGSLKDYKKGMMQKIFSQEIRVKGDNGEEYSEWEEKRFGNIIEYVSSGKTKDKYEVGKYTVYGSTGVIGYTDNLDYTGEYILVARVGANAGMVNIINEECGVSDNTLMLKYRNNIHPRFSYYQLKQYNLTRLIFGSGQPLITGGQLKKLCFKIPSLEEQQKIVNFLSTIDKKLEKEQEKLDSLNQWKKGLLQQMFV